MTGADRDKTLLMVAGEASGDLHGARLLTELRRMVPSIEAFGLGGDGLREAGLDRLADSGEISVVGITEVLKVLPRARQLFSEVLAAVDERRPRAAVLIDFPDFNLRLAEELKKRRVEVIYYVSPQVWAWRRGRVKSIAKVVDLMLVLFPFELDVYRQAGMRVAHVGHPLVDEVPQLQHVWEQGPPADEPYRLALLPGSRPNEVAALLPLMLETVHRLAQELPVLARVIKAPTVPRSMLEEPVQLSGLPVRIVGHDAGERFRAISQSHAALCASGTATLEVGLLGTPMVVVYRLASWTYLLARMLVRLPRVSLVNLVLERDAVPELIQSKAEPETVAAELAALLAAPERVTAMRADLSELRGRLGVPGASRRAAEQVVELLRWRRAG